MRLFDIVGGKVVIHNDALGLPGFREFWESSKNKNHATDVLSYIVLNNKFDSPYVESMDSRSRDLKLKKMLFGDHKYQLTEDEKFVEQEFIDLQYTRKLRLLNSMMDKIDSISKYYETSLTDELDPKMISELLKGMKEAGGVMQTLKVLEEAVKDGIASELKIIGGGKINKYEMQSSVLK